MNSVMKLRDLDRTKVYHGIYRSYRAELRFDGKEWVLTYLIPSGIRDPSESVLNNFKNLYIKENEQ